LKPEDQISLGLKVFKCANLNNTNELKNKNTSMSLNRIELLQTYLKEDPEDAFTLYALGLEYMNLEDYPMANNFFSTLVDSHPEYLPLYYHFGKLNEKVNQKMKANELYLKGVEIAKIQNDQHTLNELQQAFNSLNGIEEDNAE
jgi:tetratricopeptide (TPR) repeat protein